MAFFLFFRQATGFLAKFSLNGSQKIVVVMNNHFVAERENASKIEATFKFEGRTDIKSVKLDPDIFFRTNKVISELGMENAHVPIRSWSVLYRINISEYLNIDHVTICPLARLQQCVLVAGF